MENKNKVWALATRDALLSKRLGPKKLSSLPDDIQKLAYLVQECIKKGYGMGYWSGMRTIRENTTVSMSTALRIKGRTRKQMLAEM